MQDGANGLTLRLPAYNEQFMVERQAAVRLMLYENCGKSSSVKRGENYRGKPLFNAV